MRSDTSRSRIAFRTVSRVTLDFLRRASSVISQVGPEAISRTECRGRFFAAYFFGDEYFTLALLIFCMVTSIHFYNNVSRQSDISSDKIKKFEKICSLWYRVSGVGQESVLRTHERFEKRSRIQITSFGGMQDRGENFSGLQFNPCKDCEPAWFHSL